MGRAGGQDMPGGKTRDQWSRQAVEIDDLKAEVKAKELMLMKALSAVSHLLEYCDTDQHEDWVAAVSAMEDQELIKWIRENTVLLPVRRDGKSLDGRLAT